jgi:histidine triad (HIT) family protein
MARIASLMVAVPPSLSSGSQACVFDQILDRLAPADIVLDEPDVVAFLDIHPVFLGHTLVIPRVHYATLAEVPDLLSAEMFNTAKRIAAALEAGLGADGAFLALNNVVSQSVAHVHIHVVPRHFRDGLRGFFWPRTRYPDESSRRATARSIRDALSAQSSG